MSDSSPFASSTSLPLLTRLLISALLLVLSACGSDIPSTLPSLQDPSTARQHLTALPGVQVSGNTLVRGDDGTPVRLRGVALGDVYDYVLTGRSASADFATLSGTWRANAVRLSVHPSAWIDHRAETLGALQSQTAAALQAGLYVIIDWHTIGFPDGWHEVPDPEWGYPAYLYDSSFSLAQDFWGTVAMQINDPRVIFELWNEPVQSEDDSAAVSYWSQLKPFFEQLVTLIRSKSNGSVILASGNSWAYNLKGIKNNLLTDPNTAYTWHVYAGNDGNDPARWAAALDGLDQLKPVFVTEWGFQQPSTGDHFDGTASSFGNKFRDQFLEGRGLHSTGWSWNVDYGPALLESDWTTRTIWGDFLYSYLTRQLLRNGNAEDGLNGWNCNGCTQSTISSPRHGGLKSLRVTSRADAWAGPQQEVGAQLLNGATYKTEVWVRLASGTAKAMVTLELVTDTGTNYLTLTPHTSVTATGWTRLSGSSIVSWTGTLSAARWYVETETGTQGFYVDDAQLLLAPPP
ncbi:cellulase family glycosylhydrolase [Hyalangium versicolor]|uniref:cellulase family glycosylhydrolase n=1 Tax=Hyalangium versicolor TaxID=2861190 RepID=UPI001CCA12A8|nr:cellulase family glycosylhydrolase [Hyalangium versicolor]